MCSTAPIPVVWQEPASMVVPPGKRRRDTLPEHKHSPTEWKNRRDRITELFEDNDLHEVAAVMALEGFEARYDYSAYAPRLNSVPQYRHHLRNWGHWKYLKLSTKQWLVIGQKLLEREYAGKETAFKLNGKKIPSSKVDKCLIEKLEEGSFNVTSLRSSLSSGDISAYTASTGNEVTTAAAIRSASRLRRTNSIRRGNSKLNGSQSRLIRLEEESISRCCNISGIRRMEEAATDPDSFLLRRFFDMPSRQASTGTLLSAFMAYAGEQLPSNLQVEVGGAPEARTNEVKTGEHRLQLDFDTLAEKLRYTEERLKNTAAELGESSINFKHTETRNNLPEERLSHTRRLLKTVIWKGLETERECAELRNQARTLTAGGDVSTENLKARASFTTKLDDLKNHNEELVAAVAEKAVLLEEKANELSMMSNTLEQATARLLSMKESLAETTRVLEAITRRAKETESVYEKLHEEMEFLQRAERILSPGEKGRHANLVAVEEFNRHPIDLGGLQSRIRRIDTSLQSMPNKDQRQQPNEPNQEESDPVNLRSGANKSPALVDSQQSIRLPTGPVNPPSCEINIAPRDLNAVPGSDSIETSISSHNGPPRRQEALEPANPGVNHSDHSHQKQAGAISLEDLLDRRLWDDTTDGT